MPNQSYDEKYGRTGQTRMLIRDYDIEVVLVRERNSEPPTTVFFLRPQHSQDAFENGQARFD